MAPIILYHFPPSAPSRIGLLAFRNLNLDVEIHELNLWEKEQLKEDFVKKNPQHCVPTIDDNGFVLWESRAIAAYLVDQYYPDGHVLYPKDPQRRAIIDQRLQFDCGTLHPRIRDICWPVLFIGETKITDEKRQKLNEAFAILNTFLEGNAYVAGGNVPSLADLSVLSTISSIIQVGADLSKFKNVADWYDRCKSLPGFEENVKGATQFGERVRSRLQDKL